jgi:hypothetical protein
MMSRIGVHAEAPQPRAALRHAVAHVRLPQLLQVQLPLAPVHDAAHRGADIHCARREGSSASAEERHMGHKQDALMPNRMITTSNSSFSLVTMSAGF